MKNPGNNHCSSKEFRCVQCGALLAMQHFDHLDIRRKGLEVAIEGRAVITCYRCKKVNTVITQESRFQSKETATL